MKISKRKDGRYYGRVTINHKQVSVYGKTIPEVKLKLEKLNREKEKIMERNSVTRYLTITLGEFFEEFLDFYKKPTIKITTYDKYVGIYKRFKDLDTFKKKMNAITYYDLNLFYSECDKYYSSYLLMKELFTKAKEIGIIDFNPMAMVVRPNEITIEKRSKRLEQDDDGIPIIDDELYNRFTNYIQTLTSRAGVQCNKEFYVMFFKLLYWTGARMGEALALNYKDFDFENRLITINKTRSHDWKVVPTKSSKSTRKVPIFKEIESELKEWVDAHHGDFIFEYSTNAVVMFLDRFNKREKVHLTCHMFRKTFISNCTFKYGIDLNVIAEWVGHESLATTKKYYTFLSSDEQKKAISVIDTKSDSNCIVQVNDCVLEK